jgi:hypothetical protein
VNISQQPGNQSVYRSHALHTLHRRRTHRNLHKNALRRDNHTAHTTLLNHRLRFQNLDVRARRHPPRSTMFDFAGTQLDDASTLGSVVWKDYSVVRDEGDEYAAPSAGDIFLDEPSLKQLTCRTRGMRRGGGNGVCVTISASYSMLQSRVKSFHHTTVLVRVPFPRA